MKRFFGARMNKYILYIYVIIVINIIVVSAAPINDCCLVSLSRRDLRITVPRCGSDNNMYGGIYTTQRRGE